jgi:hypothetical protein
MHTRATYCAQPVDRSSTAKLTSKSPANRAVLMTPLVLSQQDTCAFQNTAHILNMLAACLTAAGSAADTHLSNQHSQRAIIIHFNWSVWQLSNMP